MIFLKLSCVVILLCCRLKFSVATDVDLGLVGSLIPSNFPNQNVTSYAVRYLDAKSRDRQDCLNNQLLSGPENASTCGSLAFALNATGRRDRNGRNVSRRLRNVIVLVFPGAYSLERGISVQNANGLVIAKHPEEEGDVILQCNDSENTIYNLDIRFSKNVAVRGILGTRCGPRGSALRFLVTENIIMENCIFRDNLLCGVIVLHCNNVVVKSCDFINNTAGSVYINDTELESRSFRVAGGLTLAFQNSSRPSHLTVRNCTFINNRAIVNKANNEDATLRPSSYVPRGFGGGILVFFRNSSNHKVHIKGGVFRGNTAEFVGGAVAVLFYRSPGGIGSTNNTVVIERGLFVNNSSPSGVGGAVGGLTLEAANFNGIVIKDCIIWNNLAQQGGGFAFAIRDGIESESIQYIWNNITIRNTSFKNNFSPESGGAISLMYFSRVDQITKEAVISNCNFTGNKALYGGAVHSLHYTLKFRGHNIFNGNADSAWYIVRAHVVCQDRILFQNNRAKYGGAISLQQGAVIQLKGYLNITLLGNKAVVFGGGVYASYPPLTSDLTSNKFIYQRCFVRHVQASGRVAFLDNTAGQGGGAIFTTEINTCIQTIEGSPSNSTVIKFDEDPYFFGNNTVAGPHSKIVTNEVIATAPYVLVTTAESNTISGAPGQWLSFGIRCLDQQENYMPCFWSSNFLEGVYGLPENGDVIETQVQSLKFYNITDEDFKANCSRNLTWDLRFSVIQAQTNNFINLTVVKLNITCCNPGYSLVNTMCTLDRDISAVVRADPKNQFLYLKPLLYAEDRNGKLVTSLMPIIYQNCSRLGSLPGCLFQHNDTDKQCRNGRSGFLCGVCPNGTTVDLTLSLCLTCHWWDMLVQVVFTVVWLVFCLLVLVYNVGIKSEFKGFLFYIQVIGYLFDYTTTDVVWDNRLSKIGYFSYTPLCLFPGASTLMVVSRGFVISLLMILVIVAYIISARFVKRLSNKSSFEGIWFLSFFMYKMVADTCYGILRCQRVIGGNPYEYVYHYDGSYKCFTTEDATYLTFSVMAFIVGLSVVIFPLFILFISFKRFLLTQNITDVLNKGIKPSCRWWSSFDLYRRLWFTFIILVFHYAEPSLTPLALFFSSLLVFVVFAFSSPYTSRKAYFIEAALLLDLILVASVFLNANADNQETFAPFTSTLLLLPLIAAMIYFVYKLAFLMWHRCCPKSVKKAGHKYSKNILNSLLIIIKKFKNDDNHKLTNESSSSSYHTDYSVTMGPVRVIPGTTQITAIQSATTMKDFSEYREELLSSQYS